MLVYAHYTDIFYHRGMEKDKLLVVDACSAYGQKDIKRLDRSGTATFPESAERLNQNTNS